MPPANVNSSSSAATFSPLPNLRSDAPVATVLFTSHTNGEEEEGERRGINAGGGDSDDVDHRDAAESAKVAVCGAAWWQRLIPHGGPVANVYNLASATLGAGIVSVPAGFHSSGIAVSFALMSVLCACTVYTIWLLAAAKERTGLRSYEEMASALLGRRWGYFTAAVMFLFCWGTCVGYTISVKDLLRPVLLPTPAPGTDTSNSSSSNNSSSNSNGAGGELLLTFLTCLVWAAGMLTLSLPKEINALRFASVAGVTFILFFVLCVVVHSAASVGAGTSASQREALRWVGTGMGAVNGFTLFIYSLLCQVNVFEIYEEMAAPTPRRLMRQSAVSMVGVSLLNLCSGLFGYLEFGSRVTGSLLLLYRPRESVAFSLAYVGICVKLCVGFAICIQPSRDAVYYCLGRGKTSDVSDGFNYKVSAALALLALVVSLALPDITVVFSLLGGLCGAFLSFFFPAAFYYQSFRLPIYAAPVLVSSSVDDTDGALEMTKTMTMDGSENQAAAAGRGLAAGRGQKGSDKFCHGASGGEEERGEENDGKKDGAEADAVVEVGTPTAEGREEGREGGQERGVHSSGPTKTTTTTMATSTPAIAVAATPHQEQRYQSHRGEEEEEAAAAAAAAARARPYLAPPAFTAAHYAGCAVLLLGGAAALTLGTFAAIVEYV